MSNSDNAQRPRKAIPVWRNLSQPKPRLKAGDIVTIDSNGNVKTIPKGVGNTQRLNHATSRLKALEAENARLKKRVTDLEARLQVTERTYRIPQSLDEIHPREQPAPGRTAMQEISDKWEGNEPIEDLLQQLKGFG